MRDYPELESIASRVLYVRKHKVTRTYMQRYTYVHAGLRIRMCSSTHAPVFDNTTGLCNSFNLTELWLHKEGTTVSALWNFSFNCMKLLETPYLLIGFA